MTGRTIAIAVAAFLCLLSTRCVGSYQTQPVPVEAADLESRRDLVGQTVLVDDHVTFYVPREGTAPDELQLKRTSVTFLVPRRLRPASTSRKPGVIARGVLKRAEGRLVCDVTALEPVDGDAERLEQAIAGLSAKDFESRQTWARWAERRARDFKDDALLKRAKKLEADVLRIEADMKRLTVDAPQQWLDMALDARRRQVPEPDPSALAHRALRAKLAAASDVAALKATIQAIESFFPEAASDRESARDNLASWQAAYANNPTSTYLAAPKRTQKALDRRLWADAVERLLETESTEDLPSAIAQSERAEKLLPEKPDLSGDLLEKAAKLARENLAKARKAEVKALSALYREKLHHPDEAVAIIRDWLKIQKEQLSPTDAEGPVLVANLYEELLEDRVTAVELLRKAWKIDPKSKEIAEAFRSRGFHKVKDEWIESRAPTETPSVVEKGLRGLTPDEVVARMGTKPEKVNYVASRGQLIEQWIYKLDNKTVRYVNLLHTPGDLKPRVIADYQLPRILLKGGL
jgi:hypothetical protein